MRCTGEQQHIAQISDQHVQELLAGQQPLTQYLCSFHNLVLRSTVFVLSRNSFWFKGNKRMEGEIVGLALPAEHRLSVGYLQPQAEADVIKVQDMQRSDWCDYAWEPIGQLWNSSIGNVNWNREKAETGLEGKASLRLDVLSVSCQRSFKWQSLGMRWCCSPSAR